MYAMLPPRQTYITQFCMVKVLLQVLQEKVFNLSQFTCRFLTYYVLCVDVSVIKP